MVTQASHRPRARLVSPAGFERVSSTAKNLHRPWYLDASANDFNCFADLIHSFLPKVDGEFALTLTWEPDPEGPHCYGVRVDGDEHCTGTLSITDTDLLVEDLEDLPESERSAHILGLVR